MKKLFAWSFAAGIVIGAGVSLWFLNGDRDARQWVVDGRVAASEPAQLFRGPLDPQPDQLAQGSAY